MEENTKTIRPKEDMTLMSMYEKLNRALENLSDVRHRSKNMVSIFNRDLEKEPVKTPEAVPSSDHQDIIGLFSMAIDDINRYSEQINDSISHITNKIE